MSDPTHDAQSEDIETQDTAAQASAEEQSASSDDAAAEQEVAVESEDATPSETSPAAEAVADQAGAEEAAPAEEAPDTAQEASADEPAPAEEASADQPAAETSADQPAAEEAPAEKASADEPTAEKSATEKPAAEAAASKGGDDDAKKAPPVLDEQTSLELAQLNAAHSAKAPVEGQVIGWNKGGYHVAIGKIAAFCPVSQIETGNPRKPGTYLDKTFRFHIIEIEDGGRRVVVSRASAIKAERAAKAAEIREKLKPGAELKGRVSSVTDFGAFVNLGGNIEGLVHISEISRRRVEHPKDVLKNGDKVKVSVLKIEKGGKRISLSMKRLEADPWAGVQERFEPGGKFKGTIVRKTEFGMFVEVEPGLEGLVHTSRLPLGSNLSDESLEIGTEVEGWVQTVERKRRRLSLSLREVAGGNPWKEVGQRFPEGDVVQGRVERLASFGVFIELEPGLTGLLPFSVLGTTGNPKRQFHPGKEVSVRVLSIDRDKKRISLGTEMSKAEGSPQDFKNYLKDQSAGKGGMNALAAAFAKLKDDEAPNQQ